MEEELFELVDSIYIDGKDATMTVAKINEKYYC